MSQSRTWAKDAYWKCPSCVRHFIGGAAMRQYEGLCNICNTSIGEKVDRVK